MSDIEAYILSITDPAEAHHEAIAWTTLGHSLADLGDDSGAARSLRFAALSATRAKALGGNA